MPADPVVALVLLLQGAMPTAQNLVVLLNLDEKVILLTGPCKTTFDWRQLMAYSLETC